MQVNHALFARMRGAGATGVSLWALYNSAFLSKAGPDSYVRYPGHRRCMTGLHC